MRWTSAALQGTYVQLYFNAGPLNGYAKVTSIVSSCSTNYQMWHRKYTFNVYKDDGVTFIGTGVAEHVTEVALVGGWVNGGGGNICQIASGPSIVCHDPPQPGDDAECSCWSGPHVHYGANGVKQVSWIGSGCHSVTAGKTACWNWTVP